MIIRMLSYNIRFGGDGRENGLAEVVREVEPDLVVFQEASRPQVVERLAARTGMRTWASRRDHSTGFMSRIEIASHAWHRLPGGRHPFLEIVPAGTEIRIFDLHLSAIHSKWTERRRLRELRALLRYIDRQPPGFHLLVGDFNALAPGELLDARRMPRWIRTLIWLSGGDIERETIQEMLDGGYQDGYRLRNPLAKGFTFPTWDPHVRLDYVFLPDQYSDRLASCRVVDDTTAVASASDHFPLLAEIDVS